VTQAQRTDRAGDASRIPPGRRGFDGAAARERTTDAVREIEAQTGAEVVVAVRPSSGHYRHADYLFGFVVALGTLTALLFLPVDFPIETFPLDVAVGFVLGALLAELVPPLRRLLVAPSLRQANVRRAALAAFVELGVSRTRRRTGVLIYVSMFERHVEVVADVGLLPTAVEREWEACAAGLLTAVRPRFDAQRFLDALRAFGPVLARLAPRGDDDVNELPDDRMSHA